MNDREKRNLQILQNKGELSEERKAENENAQKAYDKLLTNTNTLAVSVQLCVCVGGGGMFFFETSLKVLNPPPPPSWGKRCLGNFTKDNYKFPSTC